MKTTAIRIEGGILTPDILEEIHSKSGQQPVDFGLKASESVKDEIARTWADALDYWRIFQRKIESLKVDNPATSETRNQLIVPLLGLLGYDKLEYQKRGLQRNEKSYTISHLATDQANTPVHIVGYQYEYGLDAKPKTTTGRRMSAHAMIQEYINMGEELYAIVTDGHRLRLMRNTSRLVKFSYLEIDLERIFTENLFSDFAIFYRLLHATRLPSTLEEAPECWFEQYHQDSLDSGARIRDKLSVAVQTAIDNFGNGLLIHPDNHELRKKVDDGLLNGRDFYQLLLRLIYRTLFIMVIEERNLVYPADADQSQIDIYRNYYSLHRLRKLSENRWLGNKRHKDLWYSLLATFKLYETGGTGKKLGIYPLGGELFSPHAIETIANCSLDNLTFLTCIRSLNQYQQSDRIVRVNYGALNVEEFGSVYEGLLEFEAEIIKNGQKYDWRLNKGQERAETGSHYTADKLVQPLIKHSLEPLIERALASQDPEKALLALRVADITSGTGHTLLAASRRIARALAAYRTKEDQPSPTAYREALREVINTCIYGVDINPLAVELCKVALWLEAHNPGKPLNFLDHHIKCGNAIVGYVNEKDINGIPHEAFNKTSEDNPDTIKWLKKKNRTERPTERSHHRIKLSYDTNKDDLEDFRKEWNTLSQLPENTPEEIDRKKEAFEAFTSSESYKKLKLLASVPIAQFFIPKKPENLKGFITDSLFMSYWQGLERMPEETAAFVQKVMEEQKIFHWFLEFPEVMQNGGFHCILGNPPYLGGQALSGTFGKHFCNFVKWMYAPAGLSELAVYFLRRIHTLIKEGGFSGVITTNSIADGDIGRDGLKQIIEQNGTIIMAVRAIKWPGKANLYVSLLSVYKGDWPSYRVLDNYKVDYISSLFEEYEDLGDPENLKNNENRVFQGSILLGKGFILTHEEAARIIADDENNQQVIYKLLNGKEINSVPNQQPQRSVINFHDWGLEKAQSYDIPFEIVSELVKPARMELKENSSTNKKRKYEWWKYGGLTKKLYKNLTDLNHCFVCAATTKYLNFSAISTDYVFLNTLYVFTTDRWDLYTVVQSSIHEQWARKYSGSLETRLRYSPTDCFENYPFPGNLWEEENSELAQIGETYHAFRKSIMLKLWLGLTDLYNLFHDPELSEEKIAAKCKNPEDAHEGYLGILKLRERHKQLDNTLLKAYEWQDIDLDHDFREVDTLPENDRIRYTMSKEARKELLQRLLKLNLQKASTAAPQKKTKPKKPKTNTQKLGF